ncbi:MAG: 4Fe-4S binding protein [Desulfobacterales bacterium]|nr:4Fe-4S binding protein [Desulfobacterales bacterium]
MYKYWIWIRRCSQVIFFLLFVFFCIESRLPQDTYIDYSLASNLEQETALPYPVNIFFKFDPLLLITGILGDFQWIDGVYLSVFIIIFTLFFGRWFCGFVCPFGSLQHWVSECKSCRAKPISAHTIKPFYQVKYFIFVTCFVGLLCGLNLFGLLDPLSLLYRSFTLAVFPSMETGIKEVVEALTLSDYPVLTNIGYLGERLVASLFGYGYHAYHTGWFMGLVFILILVLNLKTARFFCRIMCPLGAFLGLLAKYSWLQWGVNSKKCTRCQACMRSCKGHVIDLPNWSPSECMLCFSCVQSCPHNAISFQFIWPQFKPKKNSISSQKNDDPYGLPRRVLIMGMLTGIATPLLTRLDGNLHKVSSSALIRPPGSFEEKDFLRLCVRCGMCVKVCPTNAIQPCYNQAGIAGFWTPTLNMKQGYCEYTCTLCSQVCPTGAIKKLTVNQKIKQPIRIGSAFIDRGKCLPWSGNGPCIVCEEHCPVSPKAIQTQETEWIMPGQKTYVKAPYVNLTRCIGCGICENRCPVKGNPAIYVIAAGESRTLKNRIML